MYWDGEHKFFAGVVAGFGKPRGGRATVDVEYDDGDALNELEADVRDEDDSEDATMAEWRCALSRFDGAASELEAEVREEDEWEEVRLTLARRRDEPR